MPGAVATAGIVACATTLTVALVVAGTASAFSQRLSSAADGAALAAADAASGAADGEPCERAQQIAAAATLTVSDCVLDGLIATVAVSGSFAGLTAHATARAGPPQ